MGCRRILLQTHKQTQANIQFTSAQIYTARCQNTCVLDMYFPKIDTKNTTNIRKTLKYQTNTLSAHFVQHHTLTFAELLPRRYDSWTLVFANFVKLLMGKKAVANNNGHASQPDYPRGLTYLHMLSKMQMIIGLRRLYLICTTRTSLGRDRSWISPPFNAAHYYEK